MNITVFSAKKVKESPQAYLEVTTFISCIIPQVVLSYMPEQDWDMGFYQI